MKHLRIKPRKIVRVGVWDIDVTKKKSTTTLNNILYIKRYNQVPNCVAGVAIRMRGQSEIIMTDVLAGELALVLRGYSYPELYTSIELGWIIQKFKYDKGVVRFVKRILNKEVNVNEITKMLKEHETKDRVVRRLTGGGSHGTLF